MAIETVVFIPGICGSVLKNGDETIWPGNALDGRWSKYPERYVDLLATSAQLVATDVLRSVKLRALGLDLLHFDGYQRALDALEGMDFRERDGSLIPFAYDWRRDVRHSAQALKDRLEQDDLTGQTIAIVAHSMGGLVARHMLERLGPPKSVKIVLCVLVAVPHLGAPVVLQNILGQRPEIFLSGQQCKTVLRSTDYPSAYQLMPRLGVPALLEVAHAAGFDIRDPYDPAVAQRLELVMTSLEAGRALGAGLDPIGPGFRPPCRYIAIVGNAQKTTTANYIEAGSARAVEEMTAGDGTVPLWSAAPPGLPVRYVAATHGGMFRNSDTVAMLKAVLRPGSPGGRTLSLEPGTTEAILSVEAADQSVGTGRPFTVAVVPDRPVTELNAVLEIEHLFADRKESREVPIRYTGGPLRSLSIEQTAPTEPAVIRCTVRTAMQQVGSDATVLAIGP